MLTCLALKDFLEFWIFNQILYSLKIVLFSVVAYSSKDFLAL